MVTSYYILKMSNNKTKLNFNYNEFYKSSYKTPLDDFTENKCRICLRDGCVSINENPHSDDIWEALRTFGNIEINVNDYLPKYLCKVCNNFINTAILFKKIAKQSDDLLKKHTKDEIKYSSTNSETIEFQDYSDPDSESNETLQNWANTENLTSVKNEKKNVRVKFTPKVPCHICKKVINKSYYKEHLTMHDPDHNKYVCDVCGKSFRLRCAYHNHSLRHRNDFPYSCQFCPYRGRYAELLKTHMRIHTGDYRYICTECPARFLFKSNLNSHMLKHKEPQFKCDSCRRAFHTKLTLQRHFEADHLGIKNHVCNMCGKAFGYRNAMMKHQRHVHKREKMLFGRMPSYLEAEQKNPKGTF